MYNIIFLLLYTPQCAHHEDLVSICHHTMIPFTYFIFPHPFPSSLLLCSLYLHVCFCLVLFICSFILLLAPSCVRHTGLFLSFQPHVSILYPALPWRCPSHAGLFLSFSFPMSSCPWAFSPALPFA